MILYLHELEHTFVNCLQAKAFSSKCSTPSKLI
jgi:hypothetical protein